MTIIYFKQRSALPNVLLLLRTCIVGATMTFAAWFGLAAENIVSVYPEGLLLSPIPGWHWLWQPLTAATTIPYPGVSFSLFFDLLLINFFITPIYTFVVSFLTEREFLKLLFCLIVVGASTFISVASLVGPTPPSSLFSGLSLSMVVFWILLHRKGQSSLFLAFPISKRWALGLTALVVLYEPTKAHEWARIGAILAMSCTAYLWGVARWRLRSHISSLEGLENWIEKTYRAISSFSFRRF